MPVPRKLLLRLMKNKFERFFDLLVFDIFLRKFVMADCQYKKFILNSNKLALTVSHECKSVHFKKMTARARADFEIVRY